MLKQTLHDVAVGETSHILWLLKQPHLYRLYIESCVYIYIYICIYIYMCNHFPSRLAKNSPYCLCTTQMVFLTSFKFLNSGSECRYRLCGRDCPVLGFTFPNRLRRAHRTTVHPHSLQEVPTLPFSAACFRQVLFCPPSPPACEQERFLFLKQTEKHVCKRQDVEAGGTTVQPKQARNVNGKAAPQKVCNMHPSTLAQPTHFVLILTGYCDRHAPFCADNVVTQLPPFSGTNLKQSLSPGQLSGQTEPKKLMQLSSYEAIPQVISFEVQWCCHPTPSPFQVQT